MTTIFTLLKVLAFAGAGILLVWGLTLQTRAIVRQQQNFKGLLIKFSAIVLLLAMIAKWPEGVFWYVGVFFAAATLTLWAATLARKSLLR